MKDEKLVLPNFAFCVLMDVIGMASFLLPMLAEVTDLVWAPVSALIFNRLFGGKLGLIGGVLNFIEEILPFTDIIPSFTIAWFVRRYTMSRSMIASR